MLQPGRHANTSDYRYGFQGQEMDNEIKGEGNSVNYKYRMHDPRVGRFFATDPLERNYPHYTPYSFSGNKVIAFRELEGMEQRHFMLYIEEDGSSCNVELCHMEKPSSYFLPDSNTYFVVTDNGETSLGSYTFRKDLPTADSDQAINLNNSYARYEEFVEDPIGSVVSGEFKTNGQVVTEIAENAVIALITRKMGNFPKTSTKSIIPITGGKYVSPWLQRVRNKVSETVSKTAIKDRKFWNKSIDFDGVKVYQRNDVFDINLVSSWKVKGKTVSGTNLERMRSGRAPVGSDGKPVNLHHSLQTEGSSLYEMTQTFHKKNHSTIHINDNSIPSGINRPGFDKFRGNYWKKRASDVDAGSNASPSTNSGG